MTHGAKQGTGATVEETGCEKGVHTEKEQLTIEVGIITEGRITGGRLHKKLCKNEQNSYSLNLNDFIKSFGK